MKNSGNNLNYHLIKVGENNYGLKYEPGAISENGALIEISEEVYKQALSGKYTLEQLFDKYALYSNKKVYEITKEINLPIKENTSTKFYGRGFLVTQEGNSFFLEYQLARHGGGSRKFQISREIYEDAKLGNYTTSELFQKYDLYHLDVPENDVTD